MENSELLKDQKIDSENYSLADFITLSDKDIFTKTRPFYDFIEDLKIKGNYSYRRKLLSACGNRVLIHDDFADKEREMIMMASNNYLGLSTHPEVMEASQKAIREYGSGMGGSPLLSGTYKLVRELEEKLAELKGCESAMVFSTGYSANVGAISGLVRPGDVILIDRLNHASIIDGCRMAGANFRTFKHNDMASLEKLLRKCDEEHMGKLIVLDGIFSMDGDIAPLPELMKLAGRYGARLMIDEAHATGVIGDHGGGTTEYFGLKGKVDLIMGTFSKALGATGGFVASTREVINYLHYYARSYMFSASITPSVVASVLAALNIVEKEPERRKKLWDNVHYMHDNLKAMGYDVFPSPPESAIIILTIGDEAKLRKMNLKIHEAGIFLNAVPYPAVPKDECRFRISLMATHTQDDLDETLDVLKGVGKKFSVI
jgi:glycine C-acetyltransferase